MQLESLRSSAEAGDTERRTLETRVVALVKQAEDASLAAAAEAESLRKALDESKEEASTLAQQQQTYRAEAEVEMEKWFSHR